MLSIIFSFSSLRTICKSQQVCKSWQSVTLEASFFHRVLSNLWKSSNYYSNVQQVGQNCRQWFEHVTKNVWNFQAFENYVHKIIPTPRNARVACKILSPDCHGIILQNKMPFDFHSTRVKVCHFWAMLYNVEFHTFQIVDLTSNTVMCNVQHKNQKQGMHHVFDLSVNAKRMQILRQQDMQHQLRVCLDCCMIQDKTMSVYHIDDWEHECKCILKHEYDLGSHTYFLVNILHSYPESDCYLIVSKLGVIFLMENQIVSLPVELFPMNPVGYSTLHVIPVAKRIWEVRFYAFHQLFRYAVYLTSNLEAKAVLLNVVPFDIQAFNFPVASPSSNMFALNTAIAPVVLAAPEQQNSMFHYVTMPVAENAKLLALCNTVMLYHEPMGLRVVSFSNSHALAHVWHEWLKQEWQAHVSGEFFVMYNREAQEMILVK